MRRVRRTILIVEDDPALRRLYREALSLAGFGVCEAGNGYEALQCLEGHKIDLVVLDLMLPMFSGHVVRAEIAAQAPNIPTVGRHAALIARTTRRAIRRFRMAVPPMRFW